jgi:hypothetical protein
MKTVVESLPDPGKLGISIESVKEVVQMMFQQILKVLCFDN